MKIITPKKSQEFDIKFTKKKKNFFFLLLQKILDKLNISNQLNHQKVHLFNLLKKKSII